MSCTKKWNLKKNTNNHDSLLNRLLDIRGIKSEKARHDFLNPLETTLIHPNAFSDMQKAVSRIAKAIDEKENIVIYGDFDADGVTSTSVLLKTIKYLGGNVDYYIPNRDTEGHGLNSAALVNIFHDKKPKLIITVDNGISNVKEVDFINTFKKDIIITDHHEAPEQMPNAYAIINPKALNALDEKLTALEIEYLTSLAGVGVAFKLAQGILEKYNKIEYSSELLPFVTIGTIADLVPLIGENRYYVTKGLDLIAKGKHYGLSRMLKIAGINTENGLTSEQVAFSIAPRINASGRLDTVDAALKILMSENKQEIEMSITTLENYNKLRQELCSQIFLEADEMWQKSGMRDNAIVLFNKDWHIGVIGIVASKFVEKYYKPTFIITYSEENKQFRCSARGVKELNIYDIISNCSEYLDGFGGHQLAGGFSFSENKCNLETIKKSINKTVDEMLNGQMLVPSVDIDMELEIKDIDISLVQEISKLEPFGMSNPSPAFVINNMIIKQKKLMGSKKEHLKLIIESPNGNIDCIFWSKGDISLIAGDKADFVFVPQINNFNGASSIQLIVKDIHSDALVEEEIPEIKIYDHRKKKNIYSQVNDYINNTKLGVSVFAEDKMILESLKPYKYITDSVVNRQTVQKNDVLMFFDYPADENIYDLIKQQACAGVYHYMNYQNFGIDKEGLLKVFSGMIKYACNNLNGEFLLTRAATALGVTDEVVELLLSMFNECNMIKIENYDEKKYTITFESGIELSKIMASSKYSELVELLNIINKYKNNFMDIELV